MTSSSCFISDYGYYQTIHQTFKMVQWRRIVERTFGWLNRYRRLSKDYEELTVNSETWIKIAMINIMVHKLKPG